jgi:hypothetical protein
LIGSSTFRPGTTVRSEKVDQLVSLGVCEVSIDNRYHRLTVVHESDTSRGYDLALITTDPHAPPGQTMKRYASRWAVEVATEDARAVERTGPCGWPA